MIETTKRVQGQEHPGTLASIADLDFAWKGQSREAEANLLMKRCFRLREHLLGSRHLDTETWLNALRGWEDGKRLEYSD